MALLIAIVALVVLPWQWKIAEATDGSEWKLTVHKIPYHKFDYLLHCIHDLSTSPSLVEYRFKCTLSWRGRSISSRTFWWPSCYPKNIKIVSRRTVTERRSFGLTISPKFTACGRTTTLYGKKLTSTERSTQNTMHRAD
jgi:hypothetical protein